MDSGLAHAESLNSVETAAGAQDCIVSEKVIIADVRSTLSVYLLTEPMQIVINGQYAAACMYRFHFS